MQTDLFYGMGEVGADSFAAHVIGTGKLKKRTDRGGDSLDGFASGSSKRELVHTLGRRRLACCVLEVDAKVKVWVPRTQCGQKMIFRDVHVALCGGDGGVSQDFLYYPEIGAIAQQKCCHGVRCHML